MTNYNTYQRPSFDRNFIPNTYYLRRNTMVVHKLDGKIETLVFYTYWNHYLKTVRTFQILDKTRKELGMKSTTDDREVAKYFIYTQDRKADFWR